MKFKDAIEEVRSRADIADVIGAHIPLKRAGRNLKGLCPFHSEKTPSFTVSQEKQLYHCFGCGAGGSVFDFVMKVRNYSFTEALEFLAARVGVLIEADDGRDRTTVDAEHRERDELVNINNLAMQFFQQCLHDPEVGGEARAYLLERGVDERCMQEFRLGFAPEGWDHLTKFLMKKAVIMKQAVKLGLVAPREPHPGQAADHYDRFRGRIIFPIFDSKSRVIGFGGRLLKSTGAPTEGGKYINSPQSPLFDKSRTFYLVDRAETAMRQSRRAVIVEGYMDAIAMHRAGIKEAIATLGTALTASHGKILSRYVDKAVALFDGDEAGMRAAQRSLAPLYQSGIEAKVVLLPGENDPDSYLQENGADALKEQLAGGISLLEYCTQMTLEAGKSSRELAAGLTEIARTLHRVSNPFQRELWLQEYARFSGISMTTLEKVKLTDLNASIRYDKGISEDDNIQGSPLNARAVGKTLYVAPKVPAFDPTSSEPRGEEEMLICLAFESQAVYEMLRSYEGPVLIQHPLLKELLLEQFARGRKSAGDLVQVLESIQDLQLKQRLQATSFAVEQIDPSMHLQAARDCMRKILMRNFELRKRELSAKIQEAVLKQDQHSLADLLRQKRDLLTKQVG